MKLKYRKNYYREYAEQLASGDEPRWLIREALDYAKKYHIKYEVTEALIKELHVEQRNKILSTGVNESINEKNDYTSI